MGPESLHRYLFKTPDQWRTGLRSNWLVTDSGLQAPQQLEARMMDGIRQADHGAVPAYDPAGTLHWVRQGSFELVRKEGGRPFVLAALPLGLNPDEWRAETLVVGAGIVWLLLKPLDPARQRTLIGFSADSFRFRAGVEPDWEIIAITRGEGDGLRAVARDDEGLWLVSISDSGHIRRLVALPELRQLAIAAVPGTNAVAVLGYPEGDRPCEDCVLWRVLLFDLSCASYGDVSEAREIFRYEGRHFPCERACNFVPCAIVADCRQTIYVCDFQTGEILALGLDGETQGFWRGLFDDCMLPVAGLAAAWELVVSAAGGILQLDITAEAASASETGTAVFLTPAMVSPDGVVRGWSRADIALDLPQHAVLEVRVAHTSDPVRIRQIDDMARDVSLTRAARLRRLGDWLPWNPEHGLVFHGADWPLGRPLRVPLHEIDDTHVWLMIRLDTHAPGPAPLMKMLQVSYPNISYSKYLPAVFQEDSRGARHLRNINCVIESVIGDLDTKLAELPAMLDPASAPSCWIPYLLRWLGLPLATELDTKAQRALLLAAPQLLRWRGTLKGLSDLLMLLVGGNFRLLDLGVGPSPWTLPARVRRNYGARLGRETLVLSAPQPGFRPGQQATLGKSPLGYTTLRTEELFARRNGLIRILVASERGNMANTESLLKRYLPYFVPAHCHYRLQIVETDSLPIPGGLNGTTEFKAPGAVRLGNTLVLGGSHLPDQSKPETGISILNRGTVINSGDYLT